MRSPLLLRSIWIAGCLSICVTCFAIAAFNSASAQEEKEKTGMLRHVVIFKFKEESSKADVQKVVDAFQKLPDQIKEIADFEYGTNNSPEGLNDGFTHCFLVTFKTEAARDVYLKHPAHMAFVEVLKPHLDKPFVIDYWADK